MTLPILFLDNAHLSNIFSGGEQSGLNILNALKSQYDLQITDVVYGEATTDTNYPKDAAIEQWVENGNITQVTTGVDPSLSNAGEISIVDAYNQSQFDGLTKFIASDDANYFVDGAGSAYSGSVMDTPTVLNQLFEGGHIQYADYQAVATAESGLTGWMSEAQAEATGLNNNGVTASVDSSGNVDIATDGNPAHAVPVTPDSIANPHSGATDVGGLVGQSGSQATATDAAVNQAVENSGGAIETLAKVGMGLIAADISSSFATAGEQYDTGNYSGASQTLGALEGRMALGTIGAAGGTMLGLDIAGALVAGGLIAAGSPFIAAAAIVGGIAAGAAAAAYGTETGALASQLSSALNTINGQFAQAMGNMELAIANQLDHLETPAVTNELIAAGNWMSGKMASIWGTAMATGSPLVLDLSSGGTGLTLSAESGAGSVLWDFGTNFLHQSGWVTGTTGLLCVDPTGTGVITQADLFGTEPPNGIANGQAANGFEALAAFDSNHDGVINSSDANFNELRVWVPSVNADAVATPGAGELYTLAQLGITSISLDYISGNYEINGNPIEQQSTFVINGNSQTIADAWFSYDPLNTIYDGSYALNPEVLFLPDQRGYGQLPELAIAMSLDSTLLGEVQNLASQSFSQLMNPTYGLEASLKTILYEWAGVESVDPTSMGTSVNAQNLQFLEQLMGQNLWNEVGNPDIFSGALVGGPVAQAWDVAFAYLSAHLLGQAGFNNLMGSPTYDPVSDSLYDAGNNPYDTAVQFADQPLMHLATNDIFVLFPGDSPTSTPLTITETADGGGTNTLALGVDPSGVALSTDAYGNLHVQYTSTDTVEIVGAMAYSGSSIAGSTVSEYVQQIAFEDGTIWNLTDGIHLTATSAYETVYGTAGGGDILDGSQITGAILHGYAGVETFIAGPATQIVAGTGTNYYVIDADSCPSSSGGATITPNASATGDQIVMHAVTESQVFLSDNSSGQLIVTTANGDLVTVNGGTYDPWDGTGVTLGNVSGIAFDDSTVWNLDGVVTLTATAGGTLYGISTGTDFVAGGYSNYFNGFNDHDVFSFTAGSAPVSAGGVTIDEHASGGTSTIAFHGLAPSAVAVSDDVYGELIFQFGTDVVTVTGGSYSSSGFTMGNLQQATFDDSTVWNLQSGLHLTATGNYEYLYGTTSGGDTLTAAGTGDHLYAFAGPEMLVGGPAAYITNGTGNDTDVINAGSSPSSNSVTIAANASGGTDSVILVHDVIASDITMWDDVYGNLTVQTPTDQFTVSGGSYSSTTGFAAGNIDHITLDDSSTIGLQGGLNLTAVNDSQAIYGTGHGDNLTAAGNYDSLHGIAGNNTMTGDSGTTYFYGGSGNDLMIGGTGSNYMVMGTGDDEIKIEGSSSTTTVTGFDATHDTIHLEDVMSGFDALADALSNWVQKTESGGNTVIAVDPTGTGSFTAGPQVTLNSVTGLDDIATLVSHGVVHV